MKLVGLIMAAGLSSRMKGFKPLMKWKGSSFIEHSINCFLGAGILDIRAVVGYRAEEVLPVLANYNVTPIYNPDYQAEMLTSIKTGVRTLENDVLGFFLMPVDTVGVVPETILMLSDRFISGEAGILYPCYKGKRGHPPLIWAGYSEAIVNWTAPGGMRAFLRERASDSIEISVDDPSVLTDIDTPEDCLTQLWVQT